MKRTLILGVLLVALCVSPAFPQNAGNAPVTKKTSGNRINEDLVFGTGRSLTIDLGATAQATRWLLSGTGAVDTIAPSQNGLGWADGRITLQTPVGALQFYETGSPSYPVIYWPGTIVSDRIESAGQFSGTVGAASITGGAGGLEQIAQAIIARSVGSALYGFFDTADAAGSTGITYADGGVGVGMQAPVGTYWMQGQVDAVGAGERRVLTSRYRTSAQARADLGVAEVVAAPASASAPGTAGQIAFDSDYFYRCVATNTWKRAALSTW